MEAAKRGAAIARPKPCLRRIPLIQSNISSIPAKGF